MKPEIAEAQPSVDYPPKPEHVGDDDKKINDPQPKPPARAEPVRYFGSVSVDGNRPGPKFGQLATEVIAHLAALNGAAGAKKGRHT